MSVRIIVLLLVFFSLLSFASELPCNLTDKERVYMETFRETVSGVHTRVPDEVISAPAEYDPAEGVIFAWEGYSSLLKKLIPFAAENDRVVVAADGSYQLNSAKKALESAGANMANIELIDVRLNSVWVRDYGPWWVYTANGDREIIDLKYNRPRPSDDNFPAKFGDLKQIRHHDCSLILAGGNLILDGYGTAIMTDVVFDSSQGGEPDLSKEELNKYMLDFFGVKKTILLKKMNRDGTGHVDMFCKLLDSHTVLVGEYKDSSSGAPGNYDILNQNAEKMASETNGKGQKFKVVRIPMPASNGGYGYTTYSYTNSLILNKKVLVPIYNLEEDSTAIDIYKQCLPDHDIKGFDCSSIIHANGAIHCITKLIMKDPLDVRHQAESSYTAGKELRINLTCSSRNPVRRASIFWSYAKEGPYRKLDLSPESNDCYSGHLPTRSDSTELHYFLEVEDEQGMLETLPEDAPDQGLFNLTAH